jgi:hypothetical protein
VKVLPQPGTALVSFEMTDMRDPADSPGHLNTPSFVLRLALATSVATLVTFIFVTLFLDPPAAGGNCGICTPSGMSIRAGDACDMEEPCDDIDRAGEADRTEEAEE